MNPKYTFPATLPGGMESLIQDLQHIDGGELRVVIAMEGVEYDLEYVREDLQKTYTEEEFDRARNIIMANQVSSDDFSALGEFGDLRVQVLVYESVVLFIFATSRYDGMAVSFDRGGTFPISETIDTVTGWLDDTEA